MAPVSAVEPTACRVKNLPTGTANGRLQRAVNLASPGDVLTVRGTCHGITMIRRDLRIRGVRTLTSGRPTLDGDDLGSVITVDGGHSVVIRDLVIRDGTAGDGAGVRNMGILRLTNVVVRGNVADTGAGAYNHASGSLTLAGSTSIRDNPADRDGGGLVNVGTLTMRDQATIHGNAAGVSSSGGGIMNSGVLVGVVCAPLAGANVYGNTPDDCSP